MSGFNPSLANITSTGSSTQTEASTAQQFLVKFWGVRGSIPTPGLDTVRYGGNTACVEVLVAGKRLIFDGGTGLRVLGKTLMAQMPIEAHLFFTHTHWDRIQGFPFFIPAFIKGNQFHIYGAMGPNGASIKQRLSDQMLRPNFPVPLQMMQSDLKFYDISPGSMVTLDDVIVETISLNRPNSALGYRITWNGHSVVYATDTEHVPDRLDPSLLYLAHEADLLIYDAAYIDHNYYDSTPINLQNSPVWEDSIKVAIAAKVKQTMMFHHDPSHDDDMLDRLERDVQARFAHVSMAREGMLLDITHH